MQNKLLHRFFSNNKALLSVTSTSYIIVKNKHWDTFMVWLYEKQLGSLSGVFQSPRCCYVKSILFLLRVYMIKGYDALTEISPFEAKWDEQKSI